MEWWFYIHTLALLSAVYLYKSNLPVVCRSDKHCTSANSTCTGIKVIDYLPNALLHLEVSYTFEWLSIVAVLLYGVYLLYKMYEAMFGKAYVINTPKKRDVGYLITPGRTKKDIANMVRNMRKVGDIPPPYPNGWYEIMRSEDLPVGGAKAVSLIGQHFAVFRRENGQVSIMDAYCPHLGANLGVGGQVHGNCIECPFHGWQFDGETGQCISIPYASKVPSFAKTKVWPSLEINKLILVWYDVDDKEPQFYPEELSSIKNGKWKYKGYTVHLINAHCQDISENGADVSHLKTVHEAGIQVGTKLDYKKESWKSKLLTHEWKVNWEPLPSPNGHVGRMTISLTSKLFGKWSIRPLDTTVVADQIGPSVVHLTFNSVFGKGAWIHTTVPEEPLVQRMTHYLYCDWWIPTFFADWFLLNGDSIQIERDAIIWDNKTYVSKPILVKEDNLIIAHRRWFSQFYSENSIRHSFKKEDEVVW